MDERGNDALVGLAADAVLEFVCAYATGAGAPLEEAMRDLLV